MLSLWLRLAWECYWNSIVDYLKDNPHLGEEPVDIEDLVNIGRRFGPYVFSTVLYPFYNILRSKFYFLLSSCSMFFSSFFFSEWKYWLFGLLFHFVSSCFRCPYYLSKELHKVVDIVFAPYNYLIDRGNRKSLQLSWHNSILIFDEAHNLVRKYITNLWLENEIYCIDHILLSVNLSILYLALSFSLL